MGTVAGKPSRREAENHLLLLSRERMVDVYPHSPIRLYGVVLNDLSREQLHLHVYLIFKK
jgi:hypothetical protein